MSKVMDLKFFDKTKNKSYSGKLEIKNKSSENAEFYIYGDIISSDWKWDNSDVNVQDVLDFLKELDDKQNIDIYVNSPGGSVFAGMTIYNVLKRNKAYKTVYVDALAGSIASVIIMAADKIIIPANSWLMIHKAWSITWGNATEMREMADLLDKLDEGILEVYKTKLKDGVEIETIKDLVEAETWLTGTDASEYFNIEVSEVVEAAACVGDISDYVNIPKELIAKVNNNHVIENKEKEDKLKKEKLELAKAKLQLELI